MTVEAAIVLLPFLVLTMMTIELVIIEYYQSLFIKSVYDTGRLIRTGNISSSTNATELQTLITDICTDAGQYTFDIFPGSGATSQCDTANTSWSQGASSTTRISVVLTVFNSVSVSSLPTFQSGLTSATNAQLVGSTVCLNTTTNCSTSGETSQVGFAGACNLVVLQAFYRWPVFVALNIPFLNSGFPTSSPAYLMSTATVFQDEAGTSGTTTCSGLAD